MGDLKDRLTMEKMDSVPGCVSNSHHVPLFYGRSLAELPAYTRVKARWVLFLISFCCFSFFFCFWFSLFLSLFAFSSLSVISFLWKYFVFCLVSSSHFFFSFIFFFSELRFCFLFFFFSKSLVFPFFHPFITLFFLSFYNTLSLLFLSL